MADRIIAQIEFPEEKIEEIKQEINKMIDIEKELIIKIIKMFRPASQNLGPYDKDELIQGPDDRAQIGFPTFFWKDCLIEDYNFTDKQADDFIELVKEFAED